MNESVITEIKKRTETYCRDSKTFFSRSFQLHIENAMLIGASIVLEQSAKRFADESVDAELL